MSTKVRDFYVTQAVGFDPLKSNNRDDVIDVPCFVPQIREKYSGLLVSDYEMSENMSVSQMPVLHNSII